MRLKQHNNKEIFFDKQFDITRYGLLDEIKKQRAQMEPANHLNNFSMNIY